MAPMCMTCRLSLPMMCSLSLLVLSFIVRINSLRVYDRQTLLDLQFSDLVKLEYANQKSLPLFLSGIPAHLCRVHFFGVSVPAAGVNVAVS